MISMELSANTGQLGGREDLHPDIGLSVNHANADAFAVMHPHVQDSLMQIHHNHNASTTPGLHEESKKKRMFLRIFFFFFFLICYNIYFSYNKNVTIKNK